MSSYIWNKRVTELRCIRCNRNEPVGLFPKGCPKCLEQGFPVSLKVAYDEEQVPSLDQTARGMLRYRDWLPYHTIPTLGEGGTPLVELPRLAEEQCIRNLWVKNEWQNPTGSHKDRMSPLIVAHAVETEKESIVVSSSGNAGVSVASYAAAAGIKCVVITTDQIHPVWEKAICLTGAEMVKVNKPHKRWKVAEELVKKGAYSATNYSDPPVGSDCYGVQGYKTLAFEIVEDLRENMPTAILLPCSRGDLLWGVAQGLIEAKRIGWIQDIPRLFAVEPFPRLSTVSKASDCQKHYEGNATQVPSIGGDTVTYQAWWALQQTGGKAVVVSGSEAIVSQEKWARYGFFLECSSAIVWPALQKLREKGEIRELDRVLLVATSHGYKGT